VDLLHKEDKAALLRLLCRRLERRGLVAGRIERILSARVPIIKFVERQSGARPPDPYPSASQPDPPACMRCQRGRSPAPGPARLALARSGCSVAPHVPL